MKNFKNSKTAKFVSGFVGLSMAAMMIPGIASAATVEELTAQINALLAQVSALQAASGNVTTTTTTTGSQVACTASFGTNLKVGSSNADVLALQRLLNQSADTQVSATGAGSPGMETSYFGPATKAAVIKFQNKYATDILSPVGLTQGTGFVGASTRAKLNTMCTSGSTTTTTTGTTLPAGCTSASGFSPTTGAACSAGTVVITGGAVSAVLDSTSPMSSGVVSPQGVATFATFRITNPTAAAVKVTMLKFTRTGISSDSTLNNVYLYSGAARLTDSASVSQGIVNFSDASGLVTVPAGSSVTVSVRADVASSMAGQTLGFMLTDAMTDAGAISGLPISGAQMTFVTAPLGMATADFVGSFVPSTGNIDPQSDIVVWQKNLNIGNRDAMMSTIRFQQIGSVYATDIKNLRLMIDGTQVGAAVDQADANRFVTFSFATPLTVKAGNHTIKVLGDVVGGSGRNFQFSLRRVVDVEITDSQLGVVVTPTNGGVAFTQVQGASTIGINAGTLTVSKDTSSPSGNVVLNGSQVTMAKFAFKANGEDLKVENLTFGYTGTSSMAAKLRAGSIFADGVQIGSQQDIVPAGTQFNLGSALVIPAGKTVVVEVRADIFNNGTGGAFLANDTFQINLIAGSSNVYQRQSLGYIANTGVSANQLTVASGSLALSAYSAYSNQTVTVPQTAYKLGEYRLTTGNTEGVNLDTVTLTLANGTLTNLTDIYVVYNGKTSQSKSTGQASQTFSINEAVAANTTMSFAVYANMNANLTGTVVSTLQVSGTSQSSGQAVTSAVVTGQTISQGTGVLTVVADASTPVSALVVGNSMPKVGSYKFTGLNDAFTIDELTFQVLGANGAAAIKNIVVKDGATTLATTPVNSSNKATSTGLTLAVAYNQNKIVDVYADLGTIGTGGATTSANVGVQLVSYEYMTSSGVKTRVFGATSTNAFYAFKTKPTITNVALPTSVLNAGAQTVAQFTITADAGGTVAWRKLTMSIASSTPSGTLTTTGYNIYDAANQSTALTGVVVTQTASTVTFTSASTDQEVSGSKTYVVKATVGGTGILAGASLSHNISSSAVFAAPNTYAVATAVSTNNFVWSDESVIGHDGTTADWMGDYLVKNLPTDSQTMTK